jgi:hypothetical protein
MNILSKIVDVIYFIDIIVNFRTTFLNKKTGEEITEPRKIALNYLLSAGFYIDLASSLPLERVGQDYRAQIVGLLKVYRITRLEKIINNLNT